MKVEIPQNGIVGSRVPIRDAALKVTGTLRYAGDIKLPHMLHAKVLFSPVAHARIKNIDVSEAEKLPGVHAVVCYKDSPKERYNGNGEDKDGHKTERVFDDVVRYVGDKVAAVAADNPQIAQKALQLIRVEYEELPFYLTAEEAMQEGAYPIHEGGNIVQEVNLGCGDVEQAMAEAYRVYEDTYTMPAIHHAAMEPHVSVADYSYDGKLTIYTPTQDAFGQRDNLHRIFGLPMNKIRVVVPAVGGGFGGKIDLVTEPITALLAMKTRRPVKLVYTRREDMISSRTRHGMKVTLRTGVKEDGTIIAQDVTAILNAGAYTSSTMSVTWAMGGKLFKLNKTPNLRYHGIPVYTNTASAGAMRGFGSPQLYFPMECQMNRIAKDLGVDFIEMQRKNLVEPYDKDLDSGMTHGNARPLDCLEKGLEMSQWEQGCKEQEASKQEGGRYRIGMGMAMASHGNGIYGVMPDTTGIIIKMNEDGTATLLTGVSDMGSGSVTAQTQIVGEVLGLQLEHIGCVQTDTDATLWDLGSYSSRGTYVGCQAAKKTAEKVRAELAKEAAQLLEISEEDMEFGGEKVVCISDPSKSATLQEVVAHAHNVNERDICCSDTFANYTNAMSYGAHFVKARVDTETGEVKILEYTAVHDVGKAINPMAVEGQIEGAIQIGMGYALSEELKYDEKGKVKNPSFKNYRLMKTTDMPEIRVGLIEALEDYGPYGAKSIGECSIVPAAGAIVNAVANALDQEFHSIPLG